MSWQEFATAAIVDLHKEAMFPFDFTWLATEDDRLEIVTWNEDKLGPVDLDAIVTRTKELASVEHVPESVTPAQAQTALDEVGLLEAFEEKVAAHPYARVRIWARSALKWERNHPYVDAFAVELGLTSDQVDDLFRAAARYSA